MGLQDIPFEQMSVNQRIQAFDERHGGSTNGDNIVISGTWILFSDGSRREVNPLGALVDFDPDPYKQTRAIIQFYGLKLKLATQAFYTLKGNLQRHTTVAVRDVRCAGEPPPQSSLDEVKVLAEKVKHFQGKLAEAEKNLELLKPDDARQFEERMQANRDGNAAFASQLGKIEV